MPEPQNRLPAADRYQRDPLFHQLVDQLRQSIEKGDYTPTELREAVILAATIHEQNTVRPSTWSNEDRRRSR